VTGHHEHNFGNRLKQARTAAGLTQGQLANLAGVSRKTMNTIEAQTVIPSTVLALRLSKVLETTVEALFFLADD
jgi:putative transcriptional regulator